MVDHRKLRKKFKYMLPEYMSRQATSRQIDAFQLYMYAFDIFHVQRYIDRFPDKQSKPRY